MRIGVTGATGRMGGTVIEVAHDRDIEVGFAVSKSPTETVRGVQIEPANRFDSLLTETNPDVVVDFTGPSSSVSYATAAAEAEVPVVIGTTGFGDEQIDQLETAGVDTPILLGANFARGVQALMDTVAVAVDSLPGYDIEVTETHHNGKQDAPSGTAQVLLNRIEEGRGESSKHVHGREGDAPRNEGEIGVHARRAGDITGEHEVLLAGNGEVLSLSHRAGSRAVFAQGAIDAASWIVDQPAGFYRFSSVASEIGETV